MEFLVCKDYEAASDKAAEIFLSLIREKPDCLLGLATGSTPLGLYQRLVKAKPDVSRITTVNLDEYYPIDPSDSQSYRTFMTENLFSPAGFVLKNTHFPDSTASDPDAACEVYEDTLRALGAPDIQLLGIGRNGHIAFNEPEEALYPYTHVTSLTEDTIAANSRFFENESQVPRHALTMGMASIMRAKKILLIAIGKDKHDAVMKLRAGRITTACPATLLMLHPDVTILCDEAAYNG